VKLSIPDKLWILDALREFVANNRHIFVHNPAPVLSKLERLVERFEEELEDVE